jgi:hypothetical protein
MGTNTYSPPPDSLTSLRTSDQMTIMPCNLSRMTGLVVAIKFVMAIQASFRCRGWLMLSNLREVLEELPGSQEITDINNTNLVQPVV